LYYASAASAELRIVVPLEICGNPVNSLKLTRPVIAFAYQNHQNYDSSSQQAVRVPFMTTYLASYNAVFT
jgi:hypothetical protein